MSKLSLAIIGTRGLPAEYSGFETLAENLVKYHFDNHLDIKLTVFCSRKNYKNNNTRYLNADLFYLPISANGISSIFYDGLSMMIASKMKCDTLLILGYSGAIFLPLVKLISKSKIVINVDGIEWQRSKWSRIARYYLKLSEVIAVKNADIIIADNRGIDEYIFKSYNKKCEIIAYGGDQAILVEQKIPTNITLLSNYSLAIARIEPENNIELIMNAFKDRSENNIVFIGNFSSTSYGKEIKEKYSKYKNILMIEAIYDLAILKSIRLNAKIYIHGHSAGGTNPSLVEIMHFGIPILAYDCIYNRYTTQDKAIYFKSSDDIINIIEKFNEDLLKISANEMKKIANKNYRWRDIGSKYFSII